MRTAPRRTIGPAVARPLAIGALGLGLAGVLAGCSTAATSGTDSAGSSTDNQSGGGSSASYADGDYTASGSYQTPDDEATIDVAVTLKDNAVTSVTVTPTATSGNAKLYQERFASGISDEVVGKRLDELSGITRVAGSSLTHAGFEEAIEKIEQEAAQ